MVPARHHRSPDECSLTVPTRTASDQVPWLAASAGLAGVVELEERRAGYQLAAADPGEQGRGRARCEDRIRCAKDRPAQPAPARKRPEPDLVRDRCARMRVAGLGRDARADWDRTPVGAQETAAAAVLHRRAPRPRRAPGAVALSSPMALEPRHRRRYQPTAGPCTWLSRPPAVHTTRKEKQQCQWNPATRRDSRATSHDSTLKIAASHRLRPRSQVHERSRLGARPMKETVQFLFIFMRRVGRRQPFG